jgi:O-antigen/teichoic acid export membrane protein
VTRPEVREVVRRNLLWLGTTTFGSMAASLVYGILLARYLGPADFGRFALVVGVGGMLTSMAQGGGSTALVVVAAQERQAAGRLLWPGVIVQGTVGVVAALVSIPVIWILSGDARLIAPSAIYGIGNLAVLLIAVPVSIYRGLDRMEWGLAPTAASFGILVLTAAVVALKLGFTATIVANTVAQAAVLGFVLPWAAKNLASQRWTLALVSRVWCASVALWAVTLVQAVHWRVGLLTVQSLSGSYQVGLYSAAAKLVENLRAIPWFLFMAVLPAFVQTVQTDRTGLKDLVQRALRYALVLAFPLSVILVILSQLVVSVLYTAEYAASVAVLRICALGLVPLFAHWVFLNALVSLRMERQLIYVYLISVLVEGGLNTLLVPRWGATGAAAGYVIGESAVALIAGFYVADAVGGLSWRQVARVISLAELRGLVS